MSKLQKQIAALEILKLATLDYEAALHKLQETFDPKNTGVDELAEHICEVVFDIEQEIYANTQ